MRKNDWLMLLLYLCMFLGAVIIGVITRTAELPAEATTEITTQETTQETTTQEITTEETRTYFDVPLSSEVQDCIFEECEKYNISPALVIAIIERESRFDAEVIGDNGRSFGLMQIQPKWHYQRMEELSCTDLLNPYQNITVGVDILAELNGQNSNIHWVLMAYNSGPATADENIALGVITEYATSIIKRSNELKKGY